MAYEIRYFELFRQIQDLLNAYDRPNPKNPYIRPVLKESVQPTIDVQKVVAETKIVKYSGVDHSAGDATIDTVPAGERWNLKFVNKGSTVNSCYMYFECNTAKGGASVGDVVAFTDASTGIVVDFVDIWLEAGSVIGINQGNVADNSTNHGYCYEVVRVSSNAD
jgi:hypothetical protein